MGHIVILGGIQDKNSISYIMRQPIYILSLALLSTICYGQTTIQTKEVKIRYTNGNEIFKICSSSCATNFEETKEYFWYTEFSKIKSTRYIRTLKEN